MSNQTFASDSGNVITPSVNFATSLFFQEHTMCQKLVCLWIWSLAQCEELLGDVKALILNHNRQVHLHWLTFVWDFRYHGSCKEFRHEGRTICFILLACLWASVADLYTLLYYCFCTPLCVTPPCAAVVLAPQCYRTGSKCLFLVCFLKCKQHFKKP